MVDGGGGGLEGKGARPLWCQPKDNPQLKVFGILKPFANFAEGEFAPSECEEVFKKGLSGFKGRAPANAPYFPLFSRAISSRMKAAFSNSSSLAACFISRVSFSMRASRSLAESLRFF